MRKLILLFVLTPFFISSAVLGADDPSIQGKARTETQKSMVEHINTNTLDGKYIIYDPVSDKLRQLKFENLHKGIVKKGSFYVSCADFVDDSGNTYDLDFLVAEKNGEYIVFQALVHSINGKKRKYHLEK